MSRRRAAEAELAGRVSFHLRDFRHETGRYDRVVSVGALERVGAAGYGAFFARLREVLADDGVAVVHAVGRADAPRGAEPALAARAPLRRRRIPLARSPRAPRPSPSSGSGL